MVNIFEPRLGRGGPSSTSWSSSSSSSSSLVMVSVSSPPLGTYAVVTSPDRHSSFAVLPVGLARAVRSQLDTAQSSLRRSRFLDGSSFSPPEEPTTFADPSDSCSSPLYSVTHFAVVLRLTSSPEDKEHPKSIFVGWAGETTTPMYSLSSSFSSCASSTDEDSLILPQTLEESGSWPRKTFVLVHVEQHLVSNREKPFTGSRCLLEPLSTSDWDVVELNSDYLEGSLLSQVCVLSGSCLRVWLHGQPNPVSLRVLDAPAVRSVPHGCWEVQGDCLVIKDYELRHGDLYSLLDKGMDLCVRPPKFQLPLTTTHAPGTPLSTPLLFSSSSSSSSSTETSCVDPVVTDFSSSSSQSLALPPWASRYAPPSSRSSPVEEENLDYFPDGEPPVNVCRVVRGTGIGHVTLHVSCLPWLRYAWVRGPPGQPGAIITRIAREDTVKNNCVAISERLRRLYGWPLCSFVRLTPPSRPGFFVFVYHIYPLRFEVGDARLNCVWKHDLGHYVVGEDHCVVNGEHLWREIGRAHV